MNKNIGLELCFIVHTRKYTDSKNIVTLLTKNQGLVSGVLRLTKRKKIIISPPVFCPIHVSWIGKTALKTITFWESTNSQFALVGSSMFCAIYMNEVIARLVHEEESSNDIFSLYASALDKLSRDRLQQLEQEKVLRAFEFSLLRELGFELNLYTDVEGAEIITQDLVFYVYDAQSGFSKISSDDPIYEQSVDSSVSKNDLTLVRLGVSTFSGNDIFSIAQGEWSEVSLKAAKKLTRLALAPLLGNKPIKARELFS